MGHGAWGKTINPGIRASGHPQCPIARCPKALVYNRLNLLMSYLYELLPQSELLEASQPRWDKILHELRH
jgi:hypothetical protein